MSTNDLTIRVRLLADGHALVDGVDRADNSLKGMNGTVNSVNESIGSMIKTAAAAVAGFIAIDSALDSWQRFDAAVNNTANLTGQALDQVKQSAVDTSIEFGRFAGDVADAMGVIGSKAPVLLEMPAAMQAVTEASFTLADAAKATGDALSDVDAATAVTAYLSQWSIAASDAASEAERFANVAAAGAQLGSASVSDMTDVMKNSGTVAASAGVSIEQFAAVTQVLAERQLEGAEAGTAFRNVLNTLLTKGPEFEKFGVSAGSVNPKIVGLEQALKNLAPILENDVALTKIFGAENLVAAQILGNGADAVGEMTAKLTGTNTAYAQAEAGLNSFSAQLEISSALLQTISAITIDELIGPALAPALAGVNQRLRDLAVSAQGISDSASFQQMSMELDIAGRYAAELYPALQMIAQGWLDIANMLNQLTADFGLIAENTDLADSSMSRFIESGLQGRTLIEIFQDAWNEILHIGSTIQALSAIASAEFTAIGAWFAGVWIDGKIFAIETFRELENWISGIGLLMGELRVAVLRAFRDMLDSAASMSNSLSALPGPFGDVAEGAAAARDAVAGMTSDAIAGQRDALKSTLDWNAGIDAQVAGLKQEKEALQDSAFAAREKAEAAIEQHQAAKDLTQTTREQIQADSDLSDEAYELAEAMKATGDFTADQVDDHVAIYKARRQAAEAADDERRQAERLTEQSESRIQDMQAELELLQIADETERERLRHLRGFAPEYQAQAEALMDQIDAQREMNQAARELKNAYEDAFSSALGAFESFLGAVLSGSGDIKQSLGNLGGSLAGIGANLSKAEQKAADKGLAFGTGDGTFGALSSASTLFENAGWDMSEGVSSFLGSTDSFAESVGGWGNVIGGAGALISLASGDYASALGTAGSMLGQWAGNLLLPGAGGMIGSVLGNLAGTMLGGALMGGETRSGGAYRMSDDGVEKIQGPSGGDIGGEQGLNFVVESIEGTTSYTNNLLSLLGSDNKVVNFTAALESSGEGRGGVWAGGELSGGGTFGEQFNGQNVFESFTDRTLTPDEAVAAFGLDLKQSIIQALQAATDLPEWVQPLLDVDAESLTEDEVNNILGNIEALAQLEDYIVQMGGNLNELTSTLTVDEITNGIQAVSMLNPVLTMLGANAFQMNSQGLLAAQALVQLAGGAEALGEKIGFFYQEFFTSQQQAQQQLDASTQAMASTFEQLGLEVPATREEFTRLVQGLDLTTESGVRTFDALMSLAPAADVVYDAAETGGDALQTFAAAMRNLPDNISANDVENVLSQAITNAASREQAGEMFASGVIQQLQNTLVNTVVGAVAQTVFNAIVSPMVQAGANSATMLAQGGAAGANAMAQGGVAAANANATGGTAAATGLAQGGAQAAGAMAAGGDAAANAMGAGGQAAGDRVGQAVAQVREFLTTMAAVMQDEGVQEALAETTTALNEIGAATYDFTQSVGTSFNAIAPSMTMAADTTSHATAQLNRAADEADNAADELAAAVDEWQQQLRVDFLGESTLQEQLLGMASQAELTSNQLANFLSLLSPERIQYYADAWGVSVETMMDAGGDVVAVLADMEQAANDSAAELAAAVDEWQTGLREAHLGQATLGESLLALADEMGLTSWQVANFLSLLTPDEIQQYALDFGVAEQDLMRSSDGVVGALRNAEQGFADFVAGVQSWQQQLNVEFLGGSTLTDTLVDYANSIGVNAEQAAEFMVNLTAEQVEAYAEQFGVSTDEAMRAATAAVQRLSNVDSGNPDTTYSNDSTNVWDRAADTTTNAAESLFDAAEALRQQVEDLRLDEQLSPLLMSERLQIAGENYQQALGAAQADTSDENVRALEQAARQYLGLGREFYGSGSEYTDIFGRVTDSMEALVGPIPQQPQQGTESQAVVEELRHLREEMAAMRLDAAGQNSRLVASNERVARAMRDAPREQSRLMSARSAVGR